MDYMIYGYVLETIQTTKKQKRKRYYWLVMPQAYLASALHIAQEICPRSDFLSQSDLSDTERNIFKKLGFSSKHSNYELILFRGSQASTETIIS